MDQFDPPPERREARVRHAATVVLTAIPIVLLISNVLSWVRTAVDLPHADDWRWYALRRADTFDLGWLFEPANDTMSPVGKALESIAQIALAGNSVVYQMLSMIVVLGLLLVFQWTLLKGARFLPLHAASAFVLTSLMMRSDTYWGNANVAYHHAIPLICVLAALVAALKGGGRRLVVVGFALGLVAGFAYISGAFGALAAGCVMTAIGWWDRHRQDGSLLRVGIGLSVAGVITAVTQLTVVLGAWGGTSHAGNPTTFPWSLDFWLYLAGKVGASLALWPGQARLAFLVTCAGVALVAISVFWALKALGRRRPVTAPDDTWIATVLLTLVATVFIYLAIVAAGRASLRSPDVDRPMELFALGFARFHFFWITAIWPWVGAVVLSWWISQRRAHRRARSIVVGGLAALCAAGLVALSVRSVALDVPKLYAEFAIRQVQALRCLQTDLQGATPQVCNLPPPLVVRDSIVYAKSIGATFAKYIQTLPDRPPIEPFYSLTDPASGSVEFVNAEALVDAPMTTLVAESDPQVIVRMADAESARNCRILEVRTAINPSIEDWAQLFYLRSGDTEWSEDRMQSVALPPAADDPADIAFEIVSETGFEPIIRFDPVSVPQTFLLQSLETRCRDLMPPRPPIVPFYSLTDPASGSVEFVNAEALVDAPMTTLVAESDPQVIVRMADAESARNCRILEVRTAIDPSIEDWAQLFYLRSGDTEWSEDRKQGLPVSPAADDPADIAFEIVSETGFEPIIRFDPVSVPQTFLLQSLEIGCRTPMP